jgi:hypothetical protein
MKSAFSLMLAASCSSLLFALSTDFYPLAVGNWWEYQLKTGGTERHEITGTQAASFVMTITTNSGGTPYVYTQTLTPFDDKGRYNAPCGRELGCFWGPRALIAHGAALTTPAGVFQPTRQYRITWGHPSGGNRDGIVSPGIGPIAYIWTSMMIGDPGDTFALLKTYHLEAAPAGYSHSWTQAISGTTDSMFSYASLGADSCSLIFRQTTQGCPKFYLVTSYNAIGAALCLYLADTAAIQCRSLGTFDHTVKVRSIDLTKKHVVKVYETMYGGDTISTRMLYQEIIPKNASACAPARPAVFRKPVRAQRVFDHGDMAVRVMAIGAGLYRYDGRREPMPSLP